MSEPNSREHLPLKHPEYQYPVSENPYAERLKEFAKLAYGNQESESHAGQWRARFQDTSLYPSPSRPLFVEIGCNGGHVILEWAKAHPEIAYIGIDWKFKQIHKASEKAAKREIQNLLFFRAHADRMGYMFGPEEIDQLNLYFPDPWPKKSQKKNRFIQEENLRTLARLVRRGGIFHIKTDHAEYFEWMLEHIEKVPDVWKVISMTKDLHKGNPNAGKLTFPEVTLFERLFIKDGIPIKEVKLERL